MKMDQNGMVFFYRELDDQADFRGTFVHESHFNTLAADAPGSRWRLGELYKRLAFPCE
jgi:hypothetical protein